MRHWHERSIDCPCDGCRGVTTTASAGYGWRSIPPTEPGWYWVRSSNDDTPEIVRVLEDGPGGPLWARSTEPNEEEGRLSEYLPTCEWAGPIQEP